MSEKVQRLEELTERVRELADEKSLAEEQQAELDSLLEEGKGLRKAIHAERGIDEFTRTISESVGEPKKESPNVIVGTTDQPDFLALADRKGFEHATKVWQEKRALNEHWGFDLKYAAKQDVTDATATVNFGETLGTPDGEQYGTVVPPFYFPGIIEPPTRMPVVADLFAQGATASNLVRLVEEHVTVSGAGATGEGQSYGLSEIQVQARDYPVRDITTLLPVTENILADLPAISSYLSMRLTKFIQLAEEEELLSGDGAGDSLTGILSLERTTKRDLASGENIPTAVMKLIAQVWAASFQMPSWVVMSPTVWGQYVTERENDAGDGLYLAGSVVDSPIRRIWGLPIVVSPVLADNVIIVGNPQAGMVFRRQGLRVESSTGYGTFFGEGLVAIRAKVRTAFAAFRPQALGILDLEPSS